MQIMFNTKLKIVGGLTIKYLLEKSRVIKLVKATSPLFVIGSPHARHYLGCRRCRAARGILP